MFKTIKRILKPKLVASDTDISGPFHCSVCNIKGVGMNPLPIYYLRELQKHRYIHNILLAETLNFEHYSCKNCGASDRDRLYALYLKEYLKRDEQISLLDIAPATTLAMFIKSYKNVIYRSMDLNMQDVDDNLDITDMHAYSENQFDFFVCSHVLEHIPDDIKAMQELYRVLKPKGKGIAMVPLNLGLEETLEDLGITSVPERWKYYGQDDHVRQYSKPDYLKRLASVGFKVESLDINYFGEKAFDHAAIFPTSVLYLVSK